MTRCKDRRVEAVCAIFGTSPFLVAIFAVAPAAQHVSHRCRTVDCVDLVIPRGPGVPAPITIPAAELIERFSRSSGPGGQSVNTADSRVELQLDVARTAALTERQRERILQALGARAAGGRLTIVASEHRAQHANRVAARERMGRLLVSALAPPPARRRRTTPTKGSQQRRLRAKKIRSQTKAQRGRPDTDS